MRSSPHKRQRVPRPRSTLATRAVVAASCIGAIAAILLLQLNLLPATRFDTTNSSDAVTQKPACNGDSSACDDHDSGTKSISTTTTQKAVVHARSKPDLQPESAHGLANPASKEWPNTVAICAMMKTEHSEDVEEWLDYHRWLGVDKVFLRENGDEVPEYLVTATQEHVNSGFLDLGTVPGDKHPNQNRWHNRCSEPDLAGAFSWIAYIDLDEFLILMDKGEAAEDPDLKAYLKKHRNAAGLSLQWLLFGSNGHKSRPEPGGPLRYFSACTGELAYQMKCMASTYHLCSTPMLGDTVHDCAYRYDGKSGRSDLDTVHPVILGDGESVATHLTTVEAAIRASAAEKEALKRGKRPITIGPKKVLPHPATTTPLRATTPPTQTIGPSTANNTFTIESGAVSTGAQPTVPSQDGLPSALPSLNSTAVVTSGSVSVASEDSGPLPVKPVAMKYSNAWEFSHVLTRGGLPGETQEDQKQPVQPQEPPQRYQPVQQQQNYQHQRKLSSERSLLKSDPAADLVSAIFDARIGETVCRSYTGHLNERQHNTHKTVPLEEQMLVLAHFVTRSYEDYISRKLPRPSGVYAHTFNRMSRTKAAAKISNETLFDQFEAEQHFNGEDPVCSSMVRHHYAERCCNPSSEELQAAGALLGTAEQVTSSVAVDTVAQGGNEQPA